MKNTKKEEHTHNMNNMNAYQIRLEILHMAHNDVSFQCQEKLRSYRDMHGGQADDATVEKYTPSTAEVVKRAAELYKFVG